MTKAVKKRKLNIKSLLLATFIGGSIGFAGLYASTRPTCSTVTSNSPRQMLHENNEALIKLAHGLGSSGNVSACSNFRMKLTSGSDGYHPYIIKIDGDQSEKIKQLKCPARSGDDNSNGQNLKYVNSVYGAVSSSSRFYSAEGPLCTGADINVIVTAKNKNNNDDTYIVFTAR